MKESGDIKVLCVFGCLLGNKTVSALIKHVLSGLVGFQVDYVFMTADDYGTYKVPAWKKIIGMTAESVHIINQKLKDVDFKKYDLVIVQGFECGWAVTKYVKDTPCIMLNDSTPTATHRMMRQFPYYSWHWKVRSWILETVYRIFCRNIFSNMDYVFPHTSWCGRSMVNDFGIPQDKVAGGTLGIDLEKWTIKEDYTNEGKVNLLFVGNEFQRKGGLFLLDVFRQVSDIANLKIVSNDSFLKLITLPEGVEWEANIKYDQIADVFMNADIFLFPTYKEHFGMVQIEALASGLPLISRDVGGVADAVVDGYNGFLMPYESTQEAWVEKIRFLIDHPEERERMGKNSRKLAEENFSLEKFKEKLEKKIREFL